MKTLKSKSLVIAFVIIAHFSYGQGTSEFLTKSDAFFKENVKNGRVAYKSIKENQAALDELLVLAKDLTVSKSDASEYQAFWTIQL